MEYESIIGKRLEGRYEITELVGEGGMANVYRAVDIMDCRQVAVKILKNEYSENEEFQRRFRDESKAIAMLSHPNIVKIYDMGFSDKVQYIVMEYIDGITLKDYIDAEQVLNWKDAVHFVIQILRALQHAHNRGIVHRDIKPQNIMLLTDGTIKVMDFGIAKFAREESRTATDQAIGTVHYISPEQARGGITDAKSDLYSVGVMFYEMLTGRKPFDNKDNHNPISVAVMHMQNTPIRPREINPNIPSGLEEIIMHAMEKDPDVRYQTAGEMIRDIEAFKGNNQIVFGYFAVPTATRRRSEVVREPVYVGATVGTPTRPTPNRSSYNGDPYMDEEETAQPAKSLVVPILTSVTIVLVVVAAIVIFLFVSKGTTDTTSTTAEVPSVVGMDYDEAVSNYPNVVFDVAEQDYTDDYEANIIYKQSVEAGTYVKKNSDGKIELDIAVSRGIQKVEVPDVKNTPYEDATETLKQLGLTVEIKKQQSSSQDAIEAGNVIKTDPEAGTTVKLGDTVTLYVSQGIDLEEHEVPDFVGMTLDDAKVEAGGEELEIEVEEAPSTEEEGIVIDQSIEAGETVEGPTKITLTVSNGEEPEGTITYSITNLPDNMSGMYTLSFTEDGEVVSTYQFVYENLTGSTISTGIEGKGSKEVKVSITSAQSGLTATIGTYNFDYSNETFSVESEDIAGALNTVILAPATTQAYTDAVVADQYANQQYNADGTPNYYYDPNGSNTDVQQ